ncbi:hypothetical protein [Gordonia sp. (in: high G+C Gram-positive bacteria)]|uniref:hypothetical protein n=1 Tax=Gordonia sp. (in: high G+C Gram-positive bacteria) TaxID=84139 RepID=UPI00199B3609|nr:hypothetical protein [Gordonia sp. (in: high G+C Gram-positive bacteria)]MBD0024314.1 hypothetical protein [Gordonia sp. (in: high G+C Gram-positive bacteria)]
MPERRDMGRASVLLGAVLTLLLIVLATPPAQAEPSGSAVPDSHTPSSQQPGSPSSGTPTTSGVPDSDTPDSDNPGGDPTGTNDQTGTNDGASTFARVDITSITPTMVTVDGPGTVSVSGMIRNTGDRPLRTVTARLERGDRITDAAGLRTAPAADIVPVSVAGPFRSFADALQPGGQTGFTLTLPLSDGGLQISEAGVYPIIVNINATPDYGSAARVADSSTLLPVLSLPSDRARAALYSATQSDPSLTESSPAEGSPAESSPAESSPAESSQDDSSYDDGSPAPRRDGSIPADTANPSRMTLLWPLAAPPQLAPGTLGGGTEPVRLISDDLAGSLAPGGRLYRNLDALRSRLLTDGEDSTESPANTPPTPEPDSSTIPSQSETSPTEASPTGDSPTGDSPTGDSPTGDSPTGDSPTEAAGTQTPGPTDRGRPAGADTNAALRTSVCLAVDPDLLITVRVMSTGYVISRDPSSPTSATTPGEGTEVAARWLADLKQLAADTCVVALPFASADLDSLAHVDNVGLTTAALTSPADIVDSILGITSVRGITIPAIGTLDSTGATVLKSATITKAVSTTATLDPDREADPGGRYKVGDIRVQTTEAPVTAALAALGAAPTTPTLTPRSQIVDLSRESVVSRRQSAAAALAFTALTPPHSVNDHTGGDQSSPLPVGGRSQFIVPPAYWSPTEADTDALLSTATVLFNVGVATPEGLETVVSELDTARRPARLHAPPGKPALSRGWWVVSLAQAAAISTHADLTWQLQSSLVRSADVEATPERYLAPLREDLLRALRSPDRDSPADREAYRAHRDRSVSAVNSTLTRMRESVTMLDPGGRYTLASERSPILLVIRNELALPIRVSLKISAPDELNIGDVGVMEIPARGTRQIQLPANADSSEATSVSIGLATSTDLALGQPITISVHSNAYGKPLFYATIVAAVLLVALVARRLWHRFRGEPDPADADRPEADDHDKQLAASTYEFRRESTEHNGGIDQYRREDAENPNPDQPPTHPPTPSDPPTEDRGDST